MGIRKGLKVTLLLLLCSCVLTGAAFAKKDNGVNGFHGVISMGPGDAEQRDVILEDVIELPELSPVDTFLIITTGSADEPAGELTITAALETEIDFGAIMKFGVVGVGFSAAGTPLFIYETVNTPNDLEVTVEINATFGSLALGLFIQEADPYRNVEFPAEFTVDFELAAQEVE